MVFKSGSRQICKDTKMLYFVSLDVFCFCSPILQALCDIEAIYTFEGTYDINTLVTGRETTGILFALNQLLKKVGCESVKMCSSMD